MPALRLRGVRPADPSSEARHSGLIAPTPVVFDFERDMEPPDWLVDGVIERGTVTVLSGDTAAGKSIVADALTVAVLKGEPWLGVEVQRGRVLYVDEENHRRIVRDRLKAFGVTNADRDGLRYFLRAGACLGERQWNEWLAEQAQSHRADLVVIDTASSATRGDVNDNTAVAALYRDALRPATISGAAVLVLHHERKQTGEFRNASQSMMGARQWAGQADAHLALKATGKLTDVAGDDGRACQRYPVELEMPKVRDGQPALPAALAIVSERNSAGRLEWMALEEAEPRVSSDDAFAARIVAFLSEREQAQNGEIAATLKVGRNDGRLRRALDGLQAEGRVRKVERGTYAVAAVAMSPI